MAVRPWHACFLGLLACAGNSTAGGSVTAEDAGGDTPVVGDPVDSGRVDAASPALDAASPVTEGGSPDGGATSVTCAGNADAGAGCYAITCNAGGVHTLQQNRDRLLADYAARRCTDACTLWAALNEAERYIFLMDTAYFGAPGSRLYPPSSANEETALDHAVALYSINGPKAGQGVLLNGNGGNDYNRIYLGFDALAQCVMRSFTAANPDHDAGYNEWVKSDDLAGPHAPFTQRDMIPWFKAIYDPQTQGPQFHFWHQDSDFTQSGIDQRLGVCGVTDSSLTESTIAFNTVHDSNPLGSYSSDGTSMGGYGWQIVGQFVGIDADWAYTPTGCAATPPVNTSATGGGTFAGMGPSLDGGVCWPAQQLGDAGSCVPDAGGAD
jgi:hypothetical protein